MLTFHVECTLLKLKLPQWRWARLLICLFLLLISSQTDILSYFVCKTKQTYGKKVCTSIEVATEVTLTELAEKKLKMLPFIWKCNSATILSACPASYLQWGFMHRTWNGLSCTILRQNVGGSSFPHLSPKEGKTQGIFDWIQHQAIKKLKPVSSCKSTQTIASHNAWKKHLLDMKHHPQLRSSVMSWCHTLLLSEPQPQEIWNLDLDIQKCAIPSHS